MCTIQMIQNTLQFKGNMMEDLNQHLKQFFQLYDTLKYNGVTNDDCGRMVRFTRTRLNNDMGRTIKQFSFDVILQILSNSKDKHCTRHESNSDC
ncbi:hypothetical protein EPI10_001202 [Gossypium australe]|uniref:Uncharacterized protein n=1 Tax=Gossypium australe TaxID=47621 RepID=A0A5B6VAJ8_9ROSI|nr:hypothetical protein EPI10_001202 [Gossypium australe]